MDKLEQAIRANVAKYGWHVQHVFGEGKAPRFSYTIGLFRTYKHPELVIIGLQHEIMDTMIRNVVDQVKAGVLIEDGGRLSGILQGFDCLFRDVERRWYRQYFGRAIDFYNKVPFPVLQCLWPDREGRFPGDPRFEARFHDVEPILFRSDN